MMGGQELLLRQAVVAGSGMVYWAGVLILARRVRQQIGRSPNMTPRGAKEPNKEKVGKITQAQLKQIAQQKLVDLNTTDLAAAMRTIAGTARNMGIEIAD